MLEAADGAPESGHGREALGAPELAGLCSVPGGSLRVRLKAAPVALYALHKTSQALGHGQSMLAQAGLSQVPMH